LRAAPCALVVVRTSATPFSSTLVPAGGAERGGARRHETETSTDGAGDLAPAAPMIIDV
jgi:hypothetical protein